MKQIKANLEIVITSLAFNYETFYDENFQLEIY